MEQEMNKCDLVFKTKVYFSEVNYFLNFFNTFQFNKFLRQEPILKTILNHNFNHCLNLYRL